MTTDKDTCPHSSCRSWHNDSHSVLPFQVLCDRCGGWWEACFPRGVLLRIVEGKVVKEAC